MDNIKSFIKSDNLSDIVKSLPPKILEYYNNGSKVIVERELRDLYTDYKETAFNYCCLPWTGCMAGILLSTAAYLATGDIELAKGVIYGSLLSFLVLPAIHAVYSNINHKNFDRNLELLINSIKKDE